MKMENGNLYMNKKELALFGTGQMLVGAGMMVLSSKQVKKGSWGKTTGNIVNFLGFSEIVAGGINIGQAAVQHLDDQKRGKEYWESQGYKVYEEQQM